ncbi:alkaline phosphatase family protein [Flavisolibacter sp. BT320]|nr:alkaline phosphatase family protein [Flavisolibacter longurius]
MMRMGTAIVFLLLGLSVHTNEHTVSALSGENKLFIITLDGLRWQEVFSGADSALSANADYNTDPSLTQQKYWDADPEERRKKLLPFFWNVIAKRGELYGNRQYGNKVNVSNPYALSYPGYNELLTGQVDPTLFGNGKVANPNPTILDFLAASETYKGKVAAFASWDAFPYILNREKSRVYINSGFDNIEGLSLVSDRTLLNRLQDELEDNKTTRSDELTFLACKNYIKEKQPSVVLLSFGGTDEAAHNKQYDVYLQQAAKADQMIAALWDYLQGLPAYAGKTSFLITTDHGRGNATSNWHTHGMLTNGSSQTWLALLGNKIYATGEKKNAQQQYQKNLKELMLKLLAK